MRMILRVRIYSFEWVLFAYLAWNAGALGRRWFCFVFLDKSSGAGMQQVSANYVHRGRGACSPRCSWLSDRLEHDLQSY